MNRAPLPTIVCLMSLLAAGSALGDTVTTQSLIQDTPSTPLARSRIAQAANWGLTEQEWSRFERIQAGPRGFWSPNLDPLTALGIEAESDQARQRYAELQVTLEAKRAERELAYQNAYNAAWAKLFPDCCPSRAWHPRPQQAHRSRPALPCLSRTNAQPVPPKRNACKAVTWHSISTWWAAKVRMSVCAAGRVKPALTRPGCNAGRSP
jgi:hypothetical protein